MLYTGYMGWYDEDGNRHYFEEEIVASNIKEAENLMRKSVAHQNGILMQYNDTSRMYFYEGVIES